MWSLTFYLDRAQPPLSIVLLFSSEYRSTGNKLRPFAPGARLFPASVWAQRHQIIRELTRSANPRGPTPILASPLGDSDQC